MITLHNSVFQTLISLFFFTIIQPILSLTWTSSTEFWDLEQTGSAFITEVNQWYCPRLTGANKYSVCNTGAYIMGGYGIMGGSGTSGSNAYYGNYWSRTYTGPFPPHNQINITYNVYAVDSWDGTTSDDHYETSLDGVNIVCWHFSAFAGYAYNFCGTSSYDDFPVVRAYLTWPHTATGSITVEFINYLDQDSTDESLGIRDIQIDFVTMASPVKSICGRSNGTPLPAFPCPCDTPNQYMVPPNSGTCFLCDSSCATCTAGTSTSCTSCYVGYYLSGGQCLKCSSNCATCSGASTTCTSCNSGWFMVGTTCYSSCNSPLTTYVSNGVTYCATPCPGQYVMWDGSCSSTCAYSTTYSTFAISPATVNTFAECTYPCGTNQFLYWNGSCLNSCPSPLTTLTYYSRGFCDYSCPSNQFLYWNGSCLSTCPAPLSGELQGSYLQRYFCWYTCQPTQYLYWNGSCLSTCPSPLSSELQGTNLKRYFCWYTCPPTQYLYWNGSCISTCPAPLSGELQGSYLQRYFCWYTCQPNEYLYWNGSCLSTCPPPLSSETEGTYLKRNFCWYTCQPDQYLYWNGSCLSTCPAPLSGELEGTYLQRQFCWYTCQPNQYLYWNGSCIDNCPSPLSGETQGSYLERNFCWYICMPWQWLYWDQTCQEDCSFPLWPETQGTYLQRQFCWFSCNSDHFVYWNGTCSSECPKPLKNEYHNGEWFCEYPCGDSQYLYWNGSCLNSCPPPLAIVREGNPSKQFCNYPCQENEFLYWDGTCQSTCDFPLVPEVEGSPERQFCWYLCNTNEYLFWNGTCSTQCDSPLTKRTTNQRKFCDYSCTPDQYLAWNGTCLDTCPYPLSIRMEGSPIIKNFCDYPCDPSEYLYWNGSCLTTCDSPLSPRIEGSPSQRKFCDYPCIGNQYLYWNGSCSTKCPLPLIIRIDIDKRFCDYLCLASEIMYWDGSCSTSCDPPLVSQSQGTPPRNYCRYPCRGNQFLFENGTCSNTCDFPLTSYASKNRMFCKYPCTDTRNEFLYWNGSCLKNCPILYASRTENNLKYCDYPCSSTEFLYWNGSCLPECSLPLAQRIADDGSLYCDFPCTNQNEILFFNGTCASDCPHPLTIKQEGSSIIRKFCVSQCPKNQYLYWNATCYNSCDFPLARKKISSINYCLNPCEANQYLYWNGSCLDSCPLPFSTRTENNLYCDYPCHSSEYLYWNGSCLPQCNSPLSSKSLNGQLYCLFPCNIETDYLYWNGTCSSQCNLPLKSFTEETKNFCKNPCDLSDYLYWNGSCLHTCPSPFIHFTDSNNYKYCTSPCGNILKYYYPELASCDQTCHQPAVIDNSTGYLQCFPLENSLYENSAFNMFFYAPLENKAWTIVKLVKVMQYVKYLDIKMPPRLQRLGISKGRNILSISSGMSIPISIEESLGGQSTNVPFVYLRNNLSSSFLVNFWDDFMTIVIAIFFSFIFLALEKISKAFDWLYPANIFSTLRTITQWNFPIMILAINIDDIILFSAIQFQTSSASDAHISLIFSVIFIMSIVILMGLISFVAFSLQKSKQQSFSKFSGFQVLFSAFRNNSIFNQLFYLFYMLRIGLPMLIVVIAKEYPLVICVPQVVISFGILGFLIYMKPFTKKTNQYQMLIFESVVLMMNICMLILTFLSSKGLQDHQFGIILGDIVILGNDFINIMCLFFLIIQIYNQAKLIKIMFNKSNAIDQPQRIGIWCRLLFYILQQSNMGFEELQYFPQNSKPKRKSQVLYNEEDDHENLEFTNPESFRNYSKDEKLRLAHLDRPKVPLGDKSIHQESTTFFENRSKQQYDDDYEIATFGGSARSFQRLKDHNFQTRKDYGMNNNHPKKLSDVSQKTLENSRKFHEKRIIQSRERSRLHEHKQGILSPAGLSEIVSESNNPSPILKQIYSIPIAGSNIFEKSLLTNWQQQYLEFSLSNQQDSILDYNQDNSRNITSPFNGIGLPFYWKEQELVSFRFKEESRTSKERYQRQGSLAYNANLRAQEKKMLKKVEIGEDDEEIFNKIQNDLESLNKIIEEEEKPKVKHEYLRKSKSKIKETNSPDKLSKNTSPDNYDLNLWRKGKQHFSSSQIFIDSKKDL